MTPEEHVNVPHYINLTGQVSISEVMSLRSQEVVGYSLYAIVVLHESSCPNPVFPTDDKTKHSFKAN